MTIVAWSFGTELELYLAGSEHGSSGNGWLFGFEGTTFKVDIDGEGIDPDVAFGREEDIFDMEEMGVLLMYLIWHIFPDIEKRFEDIDGIGLFESFVSFYFFIDCHLEGVIVVFCVDLEAYLFYAHLCFWLGGRYFGSGEWIRCRRCGGGCGGIGTILVFSLIFCRWGDRRCRFRCRAWCIWRVFEFVCRWWWVRIVKWWVIRRERGVKGKFIGFLRIRRWCSSLCCPFYYL